MWPADPPVPEPAPAGQPARRRQLRGVPIGTVADPATLPDNVVNALISCADGAVKVDVTVDAYGQIGEPPASAK